MCCGVVCFLYNRASDNRALIVVFWANNSAVISTTWSVIAATVGMTGDGVNTLFKKHSRLVLVLFFSVGWRVFTFYSISLSVFGFSFQTTPFVCLLISILDKAGEHIFFFCQQLWLLIPAQLLITMHNLFHFFL